MKLTREQMLILYTCLSEYRVMLYRDRTSLKPVGDDLDGILDLIEKNILYPNPEDLR